MTGYRRNDLDVVGRNLSDVDGIAKICGAARYMTDFRLDGMAHAKVLRSPHAHATIVSVDLSAALRMPGVYAAICGADLIGLDARYGMFIRDQPVLASGKARYVGEPVAAVAAETEEIAYAALKLILVDYRPLSAAITIGEALAPGAAPIFEAIQHAATLQPPPPGSSWVQEPSPNILFEFDYAFGDVDGLFARSAHVFDNVFSVGRQSHCALEPHVAVARWTGSAAVEVWSNNQDPFLLRADVARIFSLPMGDVRFHTGLVGGGFGAKSYCKIEPIVVLLARAAKMPVRLALTMAESMLTVSDSPAEIRLRTAVDAEGSTIARDVQVDLDGGAYADATPSVAMRIGTRFNGPYRWQAVRTKVRAIRTNTIPAGSFRGFGSGHITWASESQMDIIAARLAVSPEEFRSRNFLPVGSSGAPGEAPLDSDLIAGFEAVRATAASWPNLNAPGRGVGFAVACKGGGSSHRADARVTIHSSGKVTLAAGVAEIGQNNRTILTQIVAEVLGVAPETIQVVDVDTSATPFDSGTHASNGTTIAGRAAQEAASRALAKLKEFAASVLGGRADEYAFRSGKLIRGGVETSFANLLSRGLENPSAFEGEASIETPGGSLFWMPVWTAVEVEVDDVTGVVRVTRLAQAADVGRAINPLRCRTQLEGAAAQGLGQALFEDIVYVDGAPLTASPTRYRLPRILDIPADGETIVLEEERGPGPFGAKGVGEAGNLNIPAAIANAIYNAIGVRITALPMTPERVVNAILQSESASGGVTRASS